MRIPPNILAGSQRITILSFSIFVAASWVAAGSDDTPPSKAGKEKSHWSFRPVVAPKLPTVKGAARTAVDRFVLAPLEAKNEAMNSEADRVTLIRRVSFDLTGLPPTLAEMDAFLADTATDAYERMVDRYLASPRYGERWGKHWLDAAGYSESNGYFSADSDRPLAWRYRDYVIRAFNADKPYNRFVQEQLAGDELAGYQPDGDVTPETAELLTATHFLRNAPDGTGESDGNPDEVRIDRYTVIEGNLQNAVNCLLGLTIQCARCHRHKFEPISQKEYYSLQAILTPVYNPERWTKPNDRVVVAGTRAERGDHQARNEKINQSIKTLNSDLNAFAQPLRAEFLKERLKGLDQPLREKVLAAANVPKDKQTGEQQALLKAHAKAVTISDDDLAKRFPDFAARRDVARKAQAEREKERPRPLEKIAVFVETDPKPSAHHLLRRGVHNKPGEEVEPGALEALSSPANRFRIEPRPVGRISTGRRIALARWVTSADNPLFTRVMFNRIWQHHFGAGLVATPDNLGLSGARPTHPKLLDFLAAEFVRTGWSVKAMHRLIQRSAVYRQASTPRPGLAKLDPDNHLLGRFPLRRLDAEAMRDALLSVAGELDTRMGGTYVPTQRTAAGTVEVPESQAGAKRRAVYLQQRRTQVDTLLHLFDAPAIITTCSVRPTSTVPLQALALLNSDFARARARGFAQRLERESGGDASKRLNLAFRLACGRLPSDEESAACMRFLTSQRKVYADRKDAEDRSWTDLGQMILASNAFLYVE